MQKKTTSHDLQQPEILKSFFLILATHHVFFTLWEKQNLEHKSDSNKNVLPKAEKSRQDLEPIFQRK